MKLEVFNSSDDTLRAVTDRLIDAMDKMGVKPFHIALSGGETAQLLFKIWEQEYREKLDWNLLRFYWVDERCVAPDNAQSNYKYAEELLFNPLNIPLDHIHRIFGEQEPEPEANRYSEQVKWELPGYSSLPRFDCIILGIGGDGHTASIFSNSLNLLTDQRCYAVSEHPVTGQKRITMTGSLILNSKLIFVPVVGFTKTDILRKVLSGSGEEIIPATYILNKAKDATIFTNCKIE